MNKKTLIINSLNKKKNYDKKKPYQFFGFFCRSNISDFEITNIDDNICIINSPISKNTRNIE